MGFANLKARDFQDIDALLKEGMKRARPACGYFGHTFKGDGKKAKDELEGAFQAALVASLSELTAEGGWTWWREHRFETEKLTNKKSISIDIVGKDADGEAVLVELKYVTLAFDREKKKFQPPSDAPAFPYDALKDCLKLEIFLQDHAKADNFSFKPVYGVSIALTNDSRFWGGSRRKPPQGWSREFGDIAVKGGWIPRTLRNQGGNPDNSIFTQNRCHLNFGLDWQWEWQDFSAPEMLPGDVRSFRYAFLRPEYTMFDGSEWKMGYPRELGSASDLPFHSPDCRKRFFAKKLEVEEKEARRKAEREAT